METSLTSPGHFLYEGLNGNRGEESLNNVQALLEYLADKQALFHWGRNA